MKKNLVLVLLSTVVTVLVAVGLLRWLAPHLLGISPDLRLVKVAKEVPPFYDNVFRPSDYNSKTPVIEDPYVTRAKPFYPNMIDTGPHDLLGFRNRCIPNVADIVVIGDSQTYGINAPLETNWPSRLAGQLAEKRASVYSMAAGGWGAAEYLEIFSKALCFQPRVVVVAFYSGNDPLESFVKAYGNERWAFLKTDRRLTAADAPHVAYPAPKSEWWQVKFSDGVETVFTPVLRHASNTSCPAVKAGYAAMLRATEHMAAFAKKSGTKVVFTIIPTKELVYAAKIPPEATIPNKEYAALIRDEQANLNEFAAQIAKIPDALYVDLVGPLQAAALGPLPLYPKGVDGHPSAQGYEVIGQAVVKELLPVLPSRPSGAVAVDFGNNAEQVLFISDDCLWTFASEEVFRQNGWKKKLLTKVALRDIAALPFAGTIEAVAPQWQPRAE